MAYFRNRGLFWMILALVAILGIVAVLQLSGLSLLPLGKRYLAKYYFNQQHEHHRNYVAAGERLVILNDKRVDSLRMKHIVGVAKATRIVEYSSTAAMKRFGVSGRYGATEIMGIDAEWLISEDPIYQSNRNPAMLFLHTNVSLPNRESPGRDAIFVSGEFADTLYLGTARYRYLKGDTINRVLLTPARYFGVNGYKSRQSSDRGLFVFRYGKQEAILTGVKVESAGDRAYFYDDRVVAFSRWVDNTVSAVMKHNRKTGKVNDVKLLIANGKVLKEQRQVSRIQATSGKVEYICGVKAVDKYGVKAYMGAVEVTGNNLRFFALQFDTTTELR